MIKSKNLAIIYVLIFFSFACKVADEPKVIPTVKTNSSSEITTTTAKLWGEVVSEGSSLANDRGFVYSKNNPSPSSSDTRISSGLGKGEYNQIVTNLQSNTKYYFKAYALNASGIAYGDAKEFTTMMDDPLANATLPSISSNDPQDITYTTVKLTGNVTNDGGASVVERGFCLNTSPNPTISNLKITNSNGLGVFSTVLTQLKEGTTYYVRAFALNAKGIAYSSEFKFTTLDYSTPIVETDIITSIGPNLATLNAEIKSNGGLSITERGFIYSDNENVTLNDKKVYSSSNDIGKYAISLINLKSNTKYFVKAYAANSKGTSLGKEVSFITSQALPIKIRTNDIGTITENSVIAGLEINNDGGAPITDFGICISSINPNPSIGDRKVSFGTSIANYPFGAMQTITGLNNSTVYYIRAYAKNASEIAYGLAKTFTTSSPMSTKLKSGLVAYYPFNGNAFDASGNGNNGNVAGAILTTDRFGSSNSAFYFSSQNCVPRVEAQVNTSSITNALSISIWVRQIGAGCIAPRILDFASSPIDSPGQLQWGFSYQNTWGISHLKSNGSTFISNTYPTGPFVWTHLVYTNDGITCRFYQDGRLLGTSPNGTGLPILARNLTIGRMNHPAYDAFNGNLDDLGVWNRVLTQEEIQYLFNNNFQP